MKYKTIEATGEQWRQTRKGFGISIRTLARQLDVSAPFLSDLERGRRNWTEEMEERYDRALRALGNTQGNHQASTRQDTTGHPLTPSKQGGRGPDF